MAEEYLIRRCTLPCELATMAGRRRSSTRYTLAGLTCLRSQDRFFKAPPPAPVYLRSQFKQTLAPRLSALKRNKTGHKLALLPLHFDRQRQSLAQEAALS